MTARLASGAKRETFTGRVGRRACRVGCSTRETSTRNGAIR
jgi:hypothetical protein